MTPPIPPSPAPTGPSRLTPVLELMDFLSSQRSGGLFLILASAAALIWSNSAFGDLYQSTRLQQLGPFNVGEWVNDGLMAVFFLLVGLELRREIVDGELSSPTRLAAPGLGALGGMLVPAAIFCAFNYGNPAALRGWAVPVATDIAFALAVLGIAGKSIPLTLRVFLAALAVMDDLGAIVIIAVFYSGTLSGLLLLAAAATAFALIALGRWFGVRSLWLYGIGGLLLWTLVLGSGVHATLAGVVLAAIVPTSVGHRLEHAVEPWVAFLVLPVFGLFNAGLRFAALPAGAWLDPAALGVALGLLVGKPVGVMGALFLAARLRIARLPAGVSLTQLWGGAFLCGIGFTMSLFVDDLAFRGSARSDEIKLAVFAASLLAAVIGLAIFGVGALSARSMVAPTHDRLKP